MPLRLGTYRLTTLPSENGSSSYSVDTSLGLSSLEQELEQKILERCDDHEVCGHRPHLSLAGDASGAGGACGYASSSVIDSARVGVEGIGAKYWGS